MVFCRWVPFICRYRGGICPTGKLPPCVCFVLFSYFVFPHDHQRPSQTTETVHNCFSGPSLDRRNVLCGERAVLHRFLWFSRALSLESSLSAHSYPLIKRKFRLSRLGRSFDHPFYSSLLLVAATVVGILRHPSRLHDLSRNRFDGVR